MSIYIIDLTRPAQRGDLAAAGNHRTFEWHTGEPLPDLSTASVVSFQADGDELAWIIHSLQRCSLVPNEAAPRRPPGTAHHSLERWRAQQERWRALCAALDEYVQVTEEPTRSLMLGTLGLGPLFEMLVEARGVTTGGPGPAAVLACLCDTLGPPAALQRLQQVYQQLGEAIPPRDRRTPWLQPLQQVYQQLGEAIAKLS